MFEFRGHGLLGSVSPELNDRDIRHTQRGIAATKTKRSSTTNYTNYTNKTINDPMFADCADYY
jgi:hypothetical protein